MSTFPLSLTVRRHSWGAERRLNHFGREKSGCSSITRTYKKRGTQRNSPAWTPVKQKNTLEVSGTTGVLSRVGDAVRYGVCSRGQGRQEMESSFCPPTCSGRLIHIHSAIFGLRKMNESFYVRTEILQMFTCRITPASPDSITYTVPKGRLMTPHSERIHRMERNYHSHSKGRPDRTDEKEFNHADKMIKTPTVRKSFLLQCDRR